MINLKIKFQLSQGKKDKEVFKGVLQKHTFHSKVFATKLSIFTYNMSPVLHFT